MTTPMTKFGELKIKILHNLTEAYIIGDKKRVKELLTILKENNDFRELYLFYEEIEKINLDDKEVAKVYVENVEKLLKEKTKKVSKYCKLIDKKLNGENLTEVEVYKILDLLIEEDTLKNIDKKVLGRQKLVEFLTTKKDLVESTNEYTNNEHLLQFVLAEKFNNDFEKMLSEDEKTELSKILSMTTEDLVDGFNTLKEEVRSTLDDMVIVEADTGLKEKLRTTLTETGKMKVTKYNYYKLQQLKNGL